MEEYIEQIFSTPSWVDINGGTRAPWDFNNAPGVETGASVGNGGSEESMPSLGQATSAASTWRQPYIAGISPPLPLGALGQPKAESLSPQEGTSNGSHPMGKRSRDEEEDRCGPQENMFGTLIGQPQSARTGALQSMHQLQPMPGVSASTYGNHASLVQSQQASGATNAAPARPRVRARRGQATDPHSIAERLRRERIAERMKALQDLVPSANKTDKASMLDEIIEYVRFLQLQVKVLSMSRLGGAGASMPCITEFFTEGYNNATMGASNGAQAPSQDGMATTEKHVAQLMEDNMGLAMQYLQSKGLCLMPVSLVATMPTRPPSAPAVQDISSSSPSNAVPPTTLLSPLNTNSDGAANDLSKGVRNPPTEHQARDCLTSPSTSAKSGGNNSKEEPVRRG